MEMCKNKIGVVQKKNTTNVKAIRYNYNIGVRRKEYTTNKVLFFPKIFYMFLVPLNSSLVSFKIL